MIGLIELFEIIDKILDMLDLFISQAGDIDEAMGTIGLQGFGIGCFYVCAFHQVVNACVKQICKVA